LQIAKGRNKIEIPNYLGHETSICFLPLQIVVI
jgi:hypothetical protein